LGYREPSGLPLATVEEREEVREEAIEVVSALTERARHPEVLEGGREGDGEGEVVRIVKEEEKEKVRRLLARVLGEEERRRVVEG